MTSLKFFRIEKFGCKILEYSYGQRRRSPGIDSASKYRAREVCEYFSHGPDFDEEWHGVVNALQYEAKDYGMINYVAYVWREEEEEGYEALKRFVSVVRERAGLGCLEEEEVIQRFDWSFIQNSQRSVL
jgi:hypothetical protein